MNKTGNTPSEPSQRQIEMMQQTARIEWRSLQRFFAQGRALFVDATQDLVAVAMQVADDDLDAISRLQDAALLRLVSDDEARQWHEDDAQVWAVTVAPFILIQAQRPSDS